jgi:hypothetical protein
VAVADEPLEKARSEPASAKGRIALPDEGSGWSKLKGDQGWRDPDGNIWKKDRKHKDHWDVSDSKGNKIKEIDFRGVQIWPEGPKNKNKRPK